MHTISFDIVVWVDNLLLLTNSTADERAVQTVADALFASIGLETKGWQNGDQNGAVTTALGLHIDLRDQQRQTVRPSDAAIAELCKLRSTFFREPTPANFFAFTGKIMYFSFVGAEPICMLNDSDDETPTVRFMDFLRSQSRRVLNKRDVEWHTPDPVTFNDAVQRQCDQARDLVRNIIVIGDQRQSTPRTESYADASNNFIAGISSNTNDVFVIKAYIPSNRIAAGELISQAIACLLFGSESHIAAGDNTNAHWALVKGHTASSLGDEILRWMFHCVRAGVLHWPAYAAWVPSKCNRADPLTRPNEVPLPATSADLEFCEAGCTLQHEAIEIVRWHETTRTTTRTTASGLHSDFAHTRTHKDKPAPRADPA